MYRYIIAFNEHNLPYARPKGAQFCSNVLDATARNDLFWPPNKKVMHYFALFILASFALSGVVARKKILLFLLKLNSNLRDYLTSMDDDWTWLTCEGCSYENVEIEKIEGDAIILKHTHGVSRLLISALSDESLQRLHRTSFWHHHDETAGSGVDLHGIHPESVTAEENLKAA